MNIKCTLLVAAFSAVSLAAISADAVAGVTVGVSLGYPGAYGYVGPNYAPPPVVYSSPRPVYIPPPAYVQYDRGYGGYGWGERESRAAYCRDQQSRRHDSRDWRYEHRGPDHHDGWGHR